GGRGLRASPSTGKTHLTLQDHGGNWWRHGSLNVDREWRLEYTAAVVAGMREDHLRNKTCRRCRARLGNIPVCSRCGFLNEREPVVCPNCAAVRDGGPQCKKCGYEATRKSRLVVQADGTLKEMHGDIYRPRQTVERPETEALWERMYY